MSHTITITRDYQNSEATLSTFKLTDDVTGQVVYEAFGCEPKGPSTDESGKNQRILPGEYSLTFTDSARNGSFTRKFPQKWDPVKFFKEYPKYIYTAECGKRNVTIWIINGTSFDKRRILIHVGNSAKDTRGCYLIGKTRNPSNMTVSNSIIAIDELYSIVLRIGVEKIKYVVKEEFK